MHEMKRRAFLKGAAMGALAFTVSGVEVLLTPGRRARKVCRFACSRPMRGKRSKPWGRRLFRARVRPVLPISSTSSSRVPPEEALLEARIVNVRPPFTNFYRAALGAIDRASRAQQRPPICAARRL